MNDPSGNDPFTIISPDGASRTYDKAGTRMWGVVSDGAQTITLQTETSQMENCKRQAALEKARKDG